MLDTQAEEMSLAPGTTKKSQVWRCALVIPELGRKTQADPWDSLAFPALRERPCLKNKVSGGEKDEDERLKLKKTLAD